MTTIGDIVCRSVCSNTNALNEPIELAFCIRFCGEQKRRQHTVFVISNYMRVCIDGESAYATHICHSIQVT